MNALEIMRVVGVLLIFLFSLVLFGVALVKAFKGGGFTRRTLSYFILALGSLFILYVSYNTEKIEPADWAQILLTLSLVAITGVYAYANVKMAEEMTEQRLSEAQPYLLLRLGLKEDEVIQVPGDFKLMILNAGKGPAVNLCAALWQHAEKTNYAGTTKGYLAAGEEWEAKISHSNLWIEGTESWLPELKTKVPEREIVVAVEYYDIHHRHWASFLRFERPMDNEYAVEGEQDIVELKR